MSGKPTYKDIQRMTGLSLATISKYFNGKHVRDANRTAIQRAAAELGYRVNAVASNLRRGKSRTVGVLLPSLENDFHMAVVARVERRLRAHGISTIVTSTEGESQFRSVDLLLGRMVDAIVAVPAPQAVPALSEAVAADVPVVGMDWESPDFSSDIVTIDNVAAGRLAARHLLDNGHRRVAVVGGVDSISTMRDRGTGFFQTMDTAGVLVPDVYRVAGPLTVEQGHAAMRRLLDADRWPSALFSVNYELTMGALIAINESGLRLGRDISMVGFDNTDMAKVARPRLTVVAQPVDQIAAAVADLVIRRIDGTGEPDFVHVELSAFLEAGASVAAIHDL